MGFPMMATLGQQYNVGEKKATVILDTYVVVTKGQRVCDTGSLFLPVCMYGQHFQQGMILWINRVSLLGHHLKK